VCGQLSLRWRVDGAKVRNLELPRVWNRFATLSMGTIFERVKRNRGQYVVGIKRAAVEYDVYPIPRFSFYAIEASGSMIVLRVPKSVLYLFIETRNAAMLGWGAEVDRSDVSWELSISVSASINRSRPSAENNFSNSSLAYATGTCRRGPSLFF
jgi:hypothetical protein